MTYPAIRRISALTPLGDWPTTWAGLLSGRAVWTSTSTLTGLECVAVTVGAVPDLDRKLDAAGEGPVLRIARAVLADWAVGGEFPLYVGSNHSEAELVRTLLDEPTPEQSAAMLDDQITPSSGLRPRRVYAACAAGLHALVTAVHDLMEAEAPNNALVLALDALSVIEVVGFARAGALSRASARPFAVGRDGLSIGEGAVLVELDRSTSIDRPRILGLGISCDAFHPTDPDPSGEALQRALRTALAAAALEPWQVAAIVTHGTGTAKGDDAEATALRAIWGQHFPAVTSIKGTLGHLMGAAGLLNLAVASEICETGWVPPTAALAGDQHLGSWVVTREPKLLPRGAPVLSIASGFGGNNVAVVLGYV